MDHPLVNEASFSAANPSAYTLASIWPFAGEQAGTGAGAAAALGLRMANFGQNLGGFLESSVNRDGSIEESTVTEQSGGGGGGGGGRKRKDVRSEDESSKLVSTSSANQLSNPNGKRVKAVKSRDENGDLKAEVDANSADGNQPDEQSPKPSEPPKDYIHVRARRGQATDSHSLAERARREKISERMKILQDLVPGCNKVIGKSLVLDEIINYIQSLQRQVEFLSMKLEAVNSRMNMSPSIEGFTVKDICNPPYDAAGILYGSQAAREYTQGAQPEWLHMQIGGSFERTT